MNRSCLYLKRILVYNDFVRKHTCLFCGEIFQDESNRERRCCSPSCSTKWRHKNKPFSLFIKGHQTRVGMKHSEDFIERRKGEGNPAWKGEQATVGSKHCWARDNYPKTGTCEHCGQPKRTDWSNKYHTYNRVREDWQELCRSCHIRYDFKRFHSRSRKVYEQKLEKLIHSSSLQE